MKISIIIATYNAEKVLENCLNSIIPQLVDEVELLIIDGGSKDGTVNIIKEFESSISFWKSEPDAGIYDAWNKGLSRANGDWIMFIGADDKLEDGAIHQYMSFLDTNPDVDYISSKNVMVDLKGNIIRVKGWKWEWPLFLREMTVAHPGSLHSRKLFDTYGIYDTNYRITGDYELLLRPKENLKTAFIDYITVIMSEGGASDSIAAVKEQYLASVNTGKANVFEAWFFSRIVMLKFVLKKALRRLGINAYLKKA